MILELPLGSACKSSDRTSRAVAEVGEPGPASPTPAASGGISGSLKPPPRGAGAGSFRSEELNLSTRGQWELFRSHREQIERLILRHLPQRHPLSLESRPTRFCALGAGNCNDLDLRFLCDYIDEVHLVDIDAPALDSAVQRQKCSDAGNLHRHAPVDLMDAVRNPLSPWHASHGRPAHVSGMGGENLTQSSDSLSLSASNMGGTPMPRMPRGRFDIVLSSCVLSQLIAGVRDRSADKTRVGNPCYKEHPRFPEQRAATIVHHLRLMLDLVAPGGCAILINDVVSTDTVAQLRQVPPDDLPGLMRTLVAEERTFRGLDPAAISTSLRRFPRTVIRHWSSPWLWHLSASRSYLVYGVVFSPGEDSGFRQGRTEGASTARRSIQRRRAVSLPERRGCLHPRLEFPEP